jgi:hypothetical protein
MSRLVGKVMKMMPCHQRNVDWSIESTVDTGMSDAFFRTRLSAYFIKKVAVTHK